MQAAPLRVSSLALGKRRPAPRVEETQRVLLSRSEVRGASGDRECAKLKIGSLAAALSVRDRFDVTTASQRSLRSSKAKIGASSPLRDASSHHVQSVESLAVSSSSSSASRHQEPRACAIDSATTRSDRKRRPSPDASRYVVETCLRGPLGGHESELCRFAPQETRVRADEARGDAHARQEGRRRARHEHDQVCIDEPRSASARSSVEDRSDRKSGQAPAGHPRPAREDLVSEEPVQRLWHLLSVVRRSRPTTHLRDR